VTSPGEAGSDLPAWEVTADEQRVVDAAGAGVEVDLNASGSAVRCEPGAPGGEGEDGGQSAGGQAQTTTRGAVRAEWLVDLLSGRTAVRLHPRGLRLRGALLTGEADWQSRLLLVPLTLVACDIAGPLVLDHAAAVSLELVDCTLPALEARQLHLRHDLTVTSTQVLEGIRLVDAKVEGSLKLAHCTFGIPDTPDEQGRCLLDASGIDVEGRLSLTDSTVHGSVQLEVCNVGRGVSLAGTSLRHPITALNADGARITGSASLGEGFTATGEVRLLGAHIGGQLTCSGGEFQNPDGDALSADRAQVTGSVLLGDGFRATGKVRLLGASIGGPLICNGGTFDNPHGEALSADRAKITGSVMLGENFHATGAVRLLGATIGGQLACNGGTFNNPDGQALDAEGVVVAGELIWMKLASPPEGVLDLTHARVGVLADDRASWPACRKLRLDGFTYGSLHAAAVLDSTGRLDFIRRQERFAVQPYEQLIAVYRAGGHEGEARGIAMAKQDDLRRLGGLSRRQRAGNWVLGKTIVHGYRPSRALYGLFVLYLLTLAVVTVAKGNDAFIPVRANGDVRPAASVCTDEYPCLTPVAYAAETITPIVNLRQLDFWQPVANQDYAWFMRYWLWIATLAGWAGTTLAVVAFTGLARKD
jgi:hypothetical protein